MNFTTLTLVPKVPNPTYVKEFRRIACCTTVYKLIAKVLPDFNLWWTAWLVPHYRREEYS